MARVAAELNVATMTLYGYVPSRPELVDLMVDEVLGSRDLLPAGDGEFRAQILAYGKKTFAMYRKHPWLARVSGQRPPIGPGMLAEREYVLAAVSSLGLPTAMVNTAALTISAWINTAARQEAESILLRRATGQSNDDWRLECGELWEKWFDVEGGSLQSGSGWWAGRLDWRAMTTLWNADEQAGDAYEFGLKLLLDGIEAAAREQPPRP
jgi:AcrR family transcriptional regulator